MNLGVKNIFSNILTTFSAHSQYMPVRYRYYAEKIAKGPILKKYGYEESIFRGGHLPRLKRVGRLPKPVYSPANYWNPDKAVFGQNDYIDILGGGKLRCFNVCYNVPKWLRGKKGNEIQLLTLKHRVFAKTAYPYEHPTAWYNLRKRIKYLYQFLNRKTKTNLMKD